MNKNVIAVIAAKDEEKYIFNVVQKTQRYVNQVVVIDDGSSDKTFEKAKKAGAVVLRHIVNLGKGASLKTGCEYAISKKASIIVLLDADGQHDPKEIPRFLDKLNDSDFVFGIRTWGKNMPIVLKFGNWFIYKMTKFLFDIDIKDSQGGFRAFNTKIYNKIKWHSQGYSVESEMIANVGKKKLKYSKIPVNTIYSDKYKGTTIVDGIKIVGDMIWWRITRN